MFLAILIRVRRLLRAFSIATYPERGLSWSALITVINIKRDRQLKNPGLSERILNGLKRELLVSSADNWTSPGRNVGPGWIKTV